MSTLTPLIAWATTPVVSLALYLACSKLTSAKHLPPGPSPDPVIGNMRHIPQKNQKQVFTEWGRTYGDIVYIQILGTSIIILNSREAARDLLEKRSLNYSCRPRFVLLEELMGWDPVLPQLPYGDRFRKHRRLIQDYFKPHTLQYYRPLQELESVILVQEFMTNPASFRRHINRFAAGMIIKITYGHTVTSIDDRYVQLAETAASGTLELSSAGAMIVDFIPFLKYIPTWFPGAGFKRKALSVREDVRALFNTPFEGVKESMESPRMILPVWLFLSLHSQKFGNASISLTSTLLDTFDHNGIISATDEEDIKGIAGILYGAASDTTIAVLETFMLTMVLYPDVYEKAQAEIDRVIGPDRMPDLDDRDSLPYLEAVIMEVYRWNIPVPLGLPHRSMEDDVYRGCHIPKNSTIIANVWGMSQNADVYSDPGDFLPDRFLNSSPGNMPPDPREFLFGFGRRICPGKIFADTNIWLAVASITATLRISKALDATGKQITPPAEFMAGFISHPKPFDCVIEPRSEKISELVLQTRRNREH